MMCAGGTSSGAVAGCGDGVGMDVEGQVEVGAVGDCAGAGSGDASGAVDAGEHGPPGVGLAPSAHLGQIAGQCPTPQKQRACGRWGYPRLSTKSLHEILTDGASMGNFSGQAVLAADAGKGIVLWRTRSYVL